MLNQLFLSCVVYLRLFFLMGTPAHLPHSNMILGLVAIINVGLRMMVLDQKNIEASFGSAIDVSQGTIMMASLMSIGLLLLSIYVFMKKLGKAERWHKVASAILAMDIVVSVLLFPLSFLGFGQSFLQLISAFFVLWILMAKGNILKHALGFKLVSCILLALALEVVSSIPFSFIIANSMKV